MSDYFEQFKKQEEINESLFGGIFNKNKPQAQPVVSGTPQTNVPPVQQAPVAQVTSPIQAPQKQKKEFERNKLYPFNVSNIPALNIKSVRGGAGKFAKPEVFLKFKSPDEFKNYKAVLFYLNSGYLENDINTIKRAIKYGEVDGYGPFFYLSSLFNGNKGFNVEKMMGLTKEKLRMEEISMGAPKFSIPSKTTLKPSPKLGRQVPQQNAEQFGTIDSMKRLEKFVKYFVENIVDASGNSDEKMQGLIMDKLKSELGTNGQKPQVQPQSQAPLQTIRATKKSQKKKPQPGPYSGLSLPESFRSEIRKIINDNF